VAGGGIFFPGKKTTGCLLRGKSIASREPKPPSRRGKKGPFPFLKRKSKITADGGEVSANYFSNYLKVLGKRVFWVGSQKAYRCGRAEPSRNCSE